MGYNKHMQLQEVTDRQTWDRFVSEHPMGHPMQLWGWGEVKRLNGWKPVRLAYLKNNGIIAAAQMLQWPVPRYGKNVSYVPRGPVCARDQMGGLLESLAAEAKQRKSLYLKVEPAIEDLDLSNSWRRSNQPILLPETYTIDLTRSEDELQEPMSRKHRQYIRKSERDGVTIERLADPNNGLEPFYQIYQDTARRAGFGLHNFDYYQTVARELGEHNHIYYAFADSEPVAVLWLAAAGSTAFELYGGVTDRGGELKANYALKWRAITDMKQAGYKLYDFNGRLNEGVGQFKAGFGPDTTDWAGSFDLPFDKVGYLAWNTLFPKLKPLGRKLLRRRG